ncbi:MAG: FHA domain-containing protein, partial [Anaerolinea sp.]|nr:FHA domain-containing protein [Anaerolinea sp.]
KLVLARSTNGNVSGSNPASGHAAVSQMGQARGDTANISLKTPEVARTPAIDPVRVIASDSEMERTTRQALKDLPGANQHPLRNPQAPPKQPVLTANTNAQRKLFVRQNEIYFMLGFVDRRDIPPVPVLDGDLLGRDPRAHIYLRHDDAISHRQCEFQVKVSKNGAMQLWVKDLGSLNGTYINRAPIDPGRFVFLPARSHLRIGNTTLTVIQIYWDSTDMT